MCDKMINFNSYLSADTDKNHMHTCYYHTYEMCNTFAQLDVYINLWRFKYQNITQ